MNEDHRETVEACIRIVKRWVWEEVGINVAVDTGKLRALRELRGYADDGDIEKHLRG